MTPSFVPPEARCRRDLLCDYSVVREEPDAYVETCSQCGRKAIWNKAGRGRIDTRAYGRYHFRDLIQPVGEMRDLYIKIYGTESLRVQKPKVNRPQALEDVKREAMEHYRIISGRKKTFA